MKKLLATVMFMAITTASAAFAAPEYTIKVGYIGSDTHPTMQAMKAFAKDVDTGSKGKIKVEPVSYTHLRPRATSGILEIGTTMSSSACTGSVRRSASSMLRRTDQMRSRVERVSAT